MKAHLRHRRSAQGRGHALLPRSVSWALILTFFTTSATPAYALRSIQSREVRTADGLEESLQPGPSTSSGQGLEENEIRQRARILSSLLEELEEQMLFSETSDAWEGGSPGFPALLRRHLNKNTELKQQLENLNLSSTKILYLIAGSEDPTAVPTSPQREWIFIASVLLDPDYQDSKDEDGWGWLEDDRVALDDLEYAFSIIDAVREPVTIDKGMQLVFVNRARELVLDSPEAGLEGRWYSDPEVQRLLAFQVRPGRSIVEAGRFLEVLQMIVEQQSL